MTRRTRLRLGCVCAAHTSFPEPAALLPAAATAERASAHVPPRTATAQGVPRSATRAAAFWSQARRRKRCAAFAIRLAAGRLRPQSAPASMLEARWVGATQELVADRLRQARRARLRCATARPARPARRAPSLVRRPFAQHAKVNCIARRARPCCQPDGLVHGMICGAATLSGRAGAAEWYPALL